MVKPVCNIPLALLAGIMAVTVAEAGNGAVPVLWDPATRHPDVAAIQPVPGVRYSLVHEQTPEFLFLHEPRLAFHSNELFVSFSSAPRVECEPAQIVRFRRSADGGKTWSGVGVLAPGLEGGLKSQVAPMLSHQGRLWAFVGRYGQGAPKNGLGMELWQWFPEKQSFAPVSEGLALSNFIPFVQPQRLTNGNWIMGGHTDQTRHAAVAISEGDDWHRWTRVKIETPDADYPPMTCPETCLLIQDHRVLAVTRGRMGLAMASHSTDGGVSFSPTIESNLPMSRSKPFGGTLSTGQRYLIYNARLTEPGLRRNALLIAVTRPGELTPLRRVWKIIEGNPPALLPQLKRLGEAVERNEKDDPEATKGLPGQGPASQATMHEWAYPEAVEKDGVLYVTFSQDKRHCWLARIPVASLAGEGVTNENHTAEVGMERSDVYRSGEDGRKAYRLPNIVATRDGSLLVFCDGRKTSAADHGEINPVVRRSTDGGRSWGPITVLAGEPDEVAKIGNGCAFYDRQADTVHFIYLKNLTQAFIVSSRDSGVTFSKPREITEVFREFKFPWKYFATGHVHGIQMSNGRLVVPVWLSDCARHAEENAMFTAGVIYSDDHAATFKAGGLLATNAFRKLNEGSVFQRTDGTLCFNVRDMSRGYRITASSADGGLTWSLPEAERALYDPTCQASTLAVPSPDGTCRVLFCNPAGRADRTQLTVRLSEDGGRTWPAARIVEVGPAAYSDMAVADNGTIHVVYETGEQRPYKKVAMAKFNLDWVRGAVTGSVPAAVGTTAARDARLPALWDPGVPYPDLAAIGPVRGVEYSLVHQQTPDHLFLHEPRVAFHSNVLFVSFSSAPRLEAEPAQIVRARRSADRGVSWTEAEVVATGLTNDVRHETAPLLSHQGRLWAFVGRYGKGGQNSLGMALYRLTADARSFEPLSGGLALEGFVPFVQPQRLSNGNWIMGGHTEKVRHAAVAISHGDDVGRWKQVKIETPEGLTFPETCLLIQGRQVLAVIRSKAAYAMVALSQDAGASFTRAVESNLLMSRSKPFGGTLSTGQHYLIYNARQGARRNALLVAVTRPGELAPLRKVWKIIEGNPADLLPELGRMGEKAEAHEWAYPEAVERDGVLYVVFSQDKRHCWLARIPVASLAME